MRRRMSEKLSATAAAAAAKEHDSRVKFRVLVGCTWDDDRRSAEPGDVVSDVPTAVIKSWIKDGIIEAITVDEPKSEKR
jgi:hypothetical protein